MTLKGTAEDELFCHDCGWAECEGGGCEGGGVVGADVKSKKFLSANRGCEENLGMRLNLFCSGTNIHF